MKVYKLIKAYPGSPLLNSIVTVEDNDDTYIKVYKLVLKRLKDYEKFSCEYELYEASSNYKRLYDIVSGKKNSG